MKPYYEDEWVTLYHGDCLQITDWLAADVLVTDPPYGISYSRGVWAKQLGGREGSDGIANDGTVETRDRALTLWGSGPALVFGSDRAPRPTGVRWPLIFEKPTVACGLVGRRGPWLANWEFIFACGDWPDQTPSRGSVYRTRALASSGYSGYATKAGHPHAKPLDVLEDLLTSCPPGIIADPFAGSGSTLVAAKALGRKAIGVELEERYAEIAARRLCQDVLNFEEAL